MPYTPTVWTDNAAPLVDAAGLNNIEDGLVALDAAVPVGVAVTGDHTAAAGEFLVVTPVDGSTVVTLPASGSVGARVDVVLVPNDALDPDTILVATPPGTLLDGIDASAGSGNELELFAPFRTGFTWTGPGVLQQWRTD